MQVKGKGGISATIIADSVSSVDGKRITTYELEYPRYIHAELMTHRLFSRNAASSRAIPVKKKLKTIWKNPVIPIEWGKNKPGMQSTDVYTGWRTSVLEITWKSASKLACIGAWTLMKLGLHKQWVGRVLEPFEQYKVVLTATEFDNFFWLRCHKNAQPEIRELADCMYEARQQNVPQELDPDEWHVPYVDYTRSLGYSLPVDGDYKNGRIDLTEEEALKVSASCCAQVSYRVLDNSVEKACKIYDQLVTSKPVHSSPFEHQATPMEVTTWGIDVGVWGEGVTHIDAPGVMWSGNFKGWVQYRQLIKDNACWEFTKGEN